MPTIVISTDSNPEYSFYMPLTSLLWRKAGWNVIAIYINDGRQKQAGYLSQRQTVADGVTILNIDYQNYVDMFALPSTLAQVVRLYAPVRRDNLEEYIMMGDVDMIPLSSYFNRDFNAVNVFGYDLTDYTQVPMCYVGMTAHNWREMMGYKGYTIFNAIRGMESKYQEKAKSSLWGKCWDTDQAILTDKVMQFKETHAVNFITRTKNEKGLAVGRVDRADWNYDIGKQDGQYIDSHLLRGKPWQKNRFEDVLAMINTVGQFKLELSELVNLWEYANRFENAISASE